MQCTHKAAAFLLFFHCKVVDIFSLLFFLASQEIFSRIAVGSFHNTSSGLHSASPAPGLFDK
jgi:hypothetical protein